MLPPPNELFLLYVTGTRGVLVALLAYSSKGVEGVFSEVNSLRLLHFLPVSWLLVRYKG